MAFETERKIICSPKQGRINGMWMDISGSRQGKLLIIPKSGPIVNPVGLEMVKDLVVLLVQEVFHEDEVSTVMV